MSFLLKISVFMLDYECLALNIGQPVIIMQGFKNSVKQLILAAFLYWHLS